MNLIRIATVEDEPVMRRRLSEIFAEQADFSLQAACASAEELWEMLPTLSLDVVLIDLGLPGMSGQELIGQIHHRFPSIACIAHTVFEEPTTVFTALRAGAVGYLVKGATSLELLRSLRTLHEGGAPLTSRIARLLVGEFQPDPAGALSEREREVLSALSAGYSYKEVASQLVVSSHTIHTHVKNIYEKLQVSGRQQAVSKARKQGWLK